jgi:hypothetical protein
MSRMSYETSHWSESYALSTDMKEKAGRKDLLHCLDFCHRRKKLSPTWWRTVGVTGIEMFTCQGKVIAEPVGKKYLIDPYIAPPESCSTPVKIHAPHPDSRRVSQLLDRRRIRFKPSCPFVEGRRVVKAKVFNIDGDKGSFSHGPEHVIECGNISPWENILLRPRIASGIALLADGMQETEASGS